MLRKFVLPLLLLSGIVAPAWGQNIKPRESFPEVGVSLQPPEDFEQAYSFYGVQQPSTGASIILTAIPGPFAEIMAGFSAEQLNLRGMTLLSKEVIGDKVLLSVAQSAYGEDFLKWVLLFPDQQNQAKLVVAVFPKDQAKSLSPVLREAVLSAALLPTDADLQQTGSLPFRITPAPRLVEVTALKGVGKALILSKDGVVPSASSPSPADPLFIAAPSLGNAPVLNPQEFALQRLKQYSQLQSVEVESMRAIALDQQQGFEITANAKDRQSQTPLKVYQMMVFPDGGGYVVMIGMVGLDHAEQYLPAFKATAQTYQRLPAIGPGKSVDTR
ncbi:MAG: hypothetical protein WA902_12245 [Thermosynechococcaceae cyanobacterium]